MLSCISLFGVAMKKVLTCLFKNLHRFVNKSVHMFDQRNLTSGGVGAPVHKFDGHKAAILYWFLDKASIFRSAAEDGFLNIWDYEGIKGPNLRITRHPTTQTSSRAVNPSVELLLRLWKQRATLDLEADHHREGQIGRGKTRTCSGSRGGLGEDGEAQEKASRSNCGSMIIPKDMAGRRNNNNGEMGGQNNQFLEGLTALLHEQNRIHGEQIQQILQAREQGSTPRRSTPSTQPVYKQFRELGPTEFKDTTDPIAAKGWIRSLETIFDFMQLTDADKVRCAIFMLWDDARVWWEGARLTVDLTILTWADFKEVFYGKYFAVDNRTRLAREFLELRQGDMTVVEYVRRFERGRYFVPMITSQPVEELKHFTEGLRPAIRHDVRLSRVTTFREAVDQALMSERDRNDMVKEAQNKRLSYQGRDQQELVKKRAENKVRCSKCEKIHAGQCLRGTDACYMCKKSGHFARECPLLKEPTKGRVFAMTQEQVDLDTAIITGIKGPNLRITRHPTAQTSVSSRAVNPSVELLLRLWKLRATLDLEVDRHREGQIGRGKMRTCSGSRGGLGEDGEAQEQASRSNCGSMIIPKEFHLTFSVGNLWCGYGLEMKPLNDLLKVYTVIQLVAFCLWLCFSYIVNPRGGIQMGKKKKEFKYSSLNLSRYLLPISFEEDGVAFMTDTSQLVEHVEVASQDAEVVNEVSYVEVAVQDAEVVNEVSYVEVAVQDAEMVNEVACDPPSHLLSLPQSALSPNLAEETHSITTGGVEAAAEETDQVPSIDEKVTQATTPQGQKKHGSYANLFKDNRRNKLATQLQQSQPTGQRLNFEHPGKNGVSFIASRWKDGRYAPACVQIHGLPRDCWSPKVLGLIGSEIGRPMYTDKLTRTRERLTYARLLVEVSVNDERIREVPITLPTGAQLGLRIIYEVMPDFCDDCRRHGHWPPQDIGDTPPPLDCVPEQDPVVATKVVEEMVPKEIQSSPLPNVPDPLSQLVLVSPSPSMNSVASSSKSTDSQAKVKEVAAYLEQIDSSEATSVTLGTEGTIISDSTINPHLIPAPIVEA
ncbi:hypothetical protein ZIOFF_067344 [Zingiber officinale]|uniref:CCHC-type domain-containing protein n=1 Tax=Zingiber officinale TaxID=94328 RepID=A0A8J5BJR2_ZINOF|nr:hypothetical protein ZIOFF_067344 [Zingiber officinale]